MSIEVAKPKVKRKLLRRSIIVGLASLLVLFACAAWYLNSAHFHRWTRARLVTELEDMTGGRVEIDSFEWTLSRLEFDVRDITIHGLEGPDEVPYAHADRLLVRAKILSMLGRQVGLRQLQVERPVVHLIVYPDGRTNQPVPKAVKRSERTPVQVLFDLAVNHAEVNDGQLIINERKLPLDFSAENVEASMDYVAATGRYDGRVKVGQLKAKYASFLPTTGDAEVKFSLSKSELQLNQVHIASGSSSIEAVGALTNFLQPNIEIGYRGRVDAKQLGQVTRLAELRGGVLELNGKATYSSGKFFSNGKIIAHDTEYATSALHVRNIDAAADFIVDPKKVTIKHVVARVMGGIAKGDITVENWTEISDVRSQDKKASEQVGLARFRVQGLDVSTAADAFSTKKLDLRALKLAGTATGNVNARWRGTPRRMTAELDFTAVPPGTVRPEQLPVTADLKGTYDAGADRLQMESLNIATPEIRVSARGALGRRAERLYVSFAVNELSRLQPMLALANQQNTTVAQLAGRLSFEGVVSGTVSNPVVEGKLQLTDFEFPLDAVLGPPANSNAPQQKQPKRLRIDSGSVDVALNRQGLILRNGAVRHAGSQAKFAVSAVLFDGKFTDRSHFVTHIAIEDASIAELQQVAGYNYPVTGTLTADLNLSGTKANPEGGGSVRITNASVYGEQVKSASAELRLLDREFQISKLVAVHNGAQVAGSGSYNLDTMGFRFHVAGNNFQLASIHKLRNRRFAFAGVANFNATGTGTVKNPVINASTQLRNLVVNGERVGDATLTAITQDDSIKLTARSNFKTAELSLDGSIKMQELVPANLTLRFTDFDFMPYLQPWLQGRVSARSFSAGTVLLQGPLKEPKSLTIKAELTNLTADMQGIELRNLEPVQFSMMNGVVRVDNFQLTGPDTEMDLRGTVRVIEDDRIRLRAQGRMNLKLVESFDSDLNTAGFADFNVSIGGVVAKPTIQGEVKVTNGAVSLIDFPNGLSNINGSMVFTEDRVQIQALTAHTGGGDIQLGGFATYSPRLNFNLTAKGKDIRMRYPQGISSTGNIDLKLTGTTSNATLSGDITITRFGLNNQFDLAVYLAKSSRPIEANGPSVLNNLHLNVHVTSTPELQVQSSLAKLAGNMDLRVRGTGANPVLLGRVNVTEGQVSFNGTKYRLERGDVSFNNPTKTEPNIDVEATTRVRDYDITLGFHGQLSRGLNTNYRSDPPLPQADIINLLAFGRTREEVELSSQSGSSSYTGAVSDAILGQALTSAVGDRVQRLFGVSRVKISPEVGSAQTNPTAQVTIEQQVSNKVTITYITSLAQSSQQSIFLEYNINPQLSLIAGRDQYGVVSFDVRIRQRKR